MLKLLRVSLAASLIFITLVLPVLAGPLVLFDEGHGQRFMAGNQGELDLSGLAEQFRTSGYRVKTSPEALTPELLAEVNVLVISGAFMPLKAEEVDVVIDFVRGGGGLAIMLHIAPPLRDLLYRLEVDFTNGTLREPNSMIGDNPLDFRITDLETHPLTAGLEGFNVYGAWALRGTADQARSLARTGPYGWVDLNRDNLYSSGDAAQAFAVLVAGELGKGRFAVFGDDALFQNRFLDDDNRRLAANLAAWLAPK